VQPPCALTIAGSDSGGGAGLQADLRSFAAFGVHGAVVVTAVTAQNTLGVTDVHAVPPSSVLAQFDAVCSDLPIAAAKTGMLASAEVVRTVAESLGNVSFPVVVDPVFVSTTGHSLIGPGGVEAYLEALLPLARIVTPNVHELAGLLGRPLGSIATLADLEAAALELAQATPAIIVAKGGHLSAADGVVTDLVVLGDQVLPLPHHYVQTRNDHGTGCSFAAATAALLAGGAEPLHAITEAAAFVTRALDGAVGWRLGAGHGPIDHLNWQQADALANLDSGVA